VAIIGGGFSGLAAGVALSGRGHEVLLLERRDHLGGRAYSFIDSTTGDVVDNGQHLFMGCYHRTLAFLEKIGCRDKLRFQDSLRVDFLDREIGLIKFECPPLPAPMHVMAGLFKMKGLTLADKLRAVNVGREIRGRRKISTNAGQTNRTVAHWLDSLGQSNRIKQRFWYPLALATLNESPETASAKMVITVLREAFGRDRASASIGIARVGLSDLYTEGACAYIRSRGGHVRTGAWVRRLVIERGRAVAAELGNGQKIEADYFISAVPQFSLLDMLQDELRDREFAQVALLGSSPIVSINLWFDRRVIDREFVGLLGTRIQWLFNKDLIISTGKQSNQIALIISAARNFVDWAKPALVEMALADLRELVPESRSARLLHSVIVKERNATLAHTVDSDRLRPGARTSIQNFVLAGDWTDTGLPATIESAVVSGETAARIIDPEI